jgi:hypothetical protein
VVGGDFLVSPEKVKPPALSHKCLMLAVHPIFRTRGRRGGVAALPGPPGKRGVLVAYELQGPVFSADEQRVLYGGVLAALVGDVGALVASILPEP